MPKKKTVPAPTPVAPGLSEDTKTLIAALGLLVAYPVGLILMWVMTNWPRWVKILITLPVILFILAMFAVMGLVALGVSHQKNYDQRPPRAPMYDSQAPAPYSTGSAVKQN